MDLAALAAGRPSLQLVVVFTAVFAWLALGLFLYMLAFALAQKLRSAYEASRRALYEPAIEAVLGEEPVERVVEAYRPRRLGDADVVLAVMVEAMRHLKGPPFENMLEAAERLGLIERSLARLDSGSEGVRGRAVEALGMMGVRRAVPRLVAALDREPRGMQLVILRSLAAIKDPSSLPAFVSAARRLPAPMLPRLASLMLEFGAPAVPVLRSLINENPGAFPPAALAELLRLVAEQEDKP